MHANLVNEGILARTMPASCNTSPADTFGKTLSIAWRYATRKAQQHHTYSSWPSWRRSYCAMHHVRQVCALCNAREGWFSHLLWLSVTARSWCGESHPGPPRLWCCWPSGVPLIRRVPSVHYPQSHRGGCDQLEPTPGAGATDRLGWG
jgi:hypothetical protein